MIKVLFLNLSNENQMLIIIINSIIDDGVDKQKAKVLIVHCPSSFNNVTKGVVIEGLLVVK